jgi:hypothetical protein
MNDNRSSANGGQIMAHVLLPADLLNKLRPHYQTEWEKEQEASGQKIVGNNKLVLRILQQVYEEKKKKRPI